MAQVRGLRPTRCHSAPIEPHSMAWDKALMASSLSEQFESTKECTRQVFRDKTRTRTWAEPLEMELYLFGVGARGVSPLRMRRAPCPLLG